MPIRPMRADELPDIFLRIKKDFPPNEYPPEFSMRQQLKSGALCAYVWHQGEQTLSYAFIARGKNTADCLLFLFAVDQARRGQGIGSGFLSQLMEDLRGQYKRVYIEVVDPLRAKTPSQEKERRRRVEFYRRLGFERLPRLQYRIFDVDMLIYYRALEGEGSPSHEQAVESLRGIYSNLLPAILMNKLEMNLIPDSTRG